MSAESASQSYLVRIQFVRISLPFTHDTNFHRKKNPRLLGLDEREPWLVQVDLVLLVEVVKHAHVGDLASLFICDVEFMLLGIELGNLLDSPDFGLWSRVSIDPISIARA